MLAFTPSLLRIETIAANPSSVVAVRVVPATRFSEHFLTSSASQLLVGDMLRVDVNAFTNVATRLQF